MNRLISLATVALIAIAVGQALADTATFTVEIEASSSTTVYVGGTVDYQITGLLTNGELGLAAFAVDLLTDTGVTQPEAFGGTGMGSFARDNGLTNPTGLGGTADGDDLIQIGGAQNTIAYSGSDPPYPTGSVVEGIALSSAAVLVEGTVIASQTPGTYTVSVANPYGAVLVEDSNDVYTVAWADGSVGQDGSFEIEVQQAPVHNVTTDVHYMTIQAALNAAGAGHVIEASPLTYEEDIDFSVLDGNDVTLRSIDPSDPNIVAATIIDGGSADVVVTFAGSEDPNTVLEGFTITKDFSPGGGNIVGIEGNGTTATIRRCKVTGICSEYGDACGICGCDGLIERCQIGSAVGLSGVGLSGCGGEIVNCVISGNGGTAGGGLAYCDATIRNCLIEGNFSNDVPGFGGLKECDGDIINCTMAYNESGNNGRGLTGCNGTITNCVIWGQSQTITSSSTPTYSCIEGWTGGGKGNIDDDPLYVDDSGSGDYHLRPGSPCIDACDPNGTYSGQVDIDGEPRVLVSPFADPNSTLSSADMGADEVIDCEPPMDSTLPRTQNNVILLYFSEDIELPQGDPLSIVPIGGDPNTDDVGDDFIYSLETLVVTNDTLKAREDGAALSDQTWYRVTAATGFNPPETFTLDLCTLRGDADDSDRVTTADYSVVKAHLGQRDTEYDGLRADLNGSTRVTTADYSVVKANLGHRAPTKP